MSDNPHVFDGAYRGRRQGTRRSLQVLPRSLSRSVGTGRGFDVPIMHLWGFEDGLAVRLEIVLDVPTMQALR
jgi:hypothetical protein